MAAPLRQHFASLAVVVQIHQEGELDAMPVFDQVLFPSPPLAPGFSFHQIRLPCEAELTTSG